MIKEIKSRQNEQIKRIVKLNDSKYRNEVKEFKVDGFHMFEMAMQAGLVKEIYVLKPIKDVDIPQFVVSKEVMEKISSTKSPQGIVSVCKMSEKKEVKNDKVLYLDDVSDPGNLGTILRTALAFNFLDVVLSENCCSIYNDKVLQASQGAIFKLNIVSGKKLKDLKAKSYQVLATEIKGSISLKDVKIKDKFVLVLGNEAHGVSQEILTLADQRVRIDIENIESLNVAIAGAIAMYSLK